MTPEEYGAVGDGVADDRAAVQAAIHAAAAVGGRVQLTGGRAYRCVIDNTVPDLGLIAESNATLDTSGARINLECTGAVYGLRYQSKFHLCGNGTIATTASNSVPNASDIWHAPIAIGPALGEVTSPSALGSYSKPCNWSVRDVTVTNVRAGGYHIVGLGGPENGVIEDVILPGDATSIGCINFDWGTVGPLQTGTPSGVLNAYKASWLAKQFYTQHPNNITIRRITIGNMTNPGSMPIRLSGCDGIVIEQVKIAGCRSAGLTHVGGDIGYEYAENGTIQRKGMLGNVFRDIEISQCNSGNAVVINSFADNVYGVSGYTPNMDPVYPTNIMVENVRAEGNFSPSNPAGIDLSFVNGGTVRNCSMLGFGNGIRAGDGATRTRIEQNTVWANSGDGIFVGGSSVPPTDISVEKNWCWANGSGATNAGIRFANGARHRAVNNKLGYPGEGGQYYGIQCDPSVTDPFIFENYISRVKAGGAGIAKGNAVQIAWNTFDPSIPANRQII